MIILILLYYFLIFNLFYTKSNNFRESFVHTFVIFSIHIFLTTELLSFFNQLNFYSLSFFYIICIGVIFYFTREFKLPKFYSTKFSYFESFIIFLICFSLSITFIIAIISAPNNYDSMTYHMSRVTNWIQNNSVSFYPTNEWRQNSFPPLSEYIILNLQILSNSDRYANMVQWFSFLISIITISLISKKLNLRLKSQIYSGILISTLPMAILQSSSTQNDLILSAYILIFYYYQICLYKNKSSFFIIFSGLSLGLGVLTKVTGYFFFFSVGFSFFLLSIASTGQKIKHTFDTLKILLIGLIINVPHYYRCFSYYGNILGSKDSSVAINEKFSAMVVFSNIVKNIGYQLGTNSDLANYYVYRVVQELVGENFNDPMISLGGLVYRPPRYYLHEDHAGNLIHILIIVLFSFIAFFIIKKLNKVKKITIAIPFLSIFLYNLVLKWQPFTNKMLPLIIIFLPFIVLIIDHFQKNKYKAKIYDILIISTFIFSINYLLKNKSRPLIPLDKNSVIFIDREKGYFANLPAIYGEYKSITNRIKADVHKSTKIELVLLHLDYNSWDYPFWVMIKKKDNNPNIDIRRTVLVETQLKIDKFHLPNFIIIDNRLIEDIDSIKMKYEKILIEGSLTLLKLLS
jgi:hypothetical protein